MGLRGAGGEIEGMIWTLQSKIGKSSTWILLEIAAELVFCAPLNGAALYLLTDCWEISIAAVHVQIPAQMKCLEDPNGER